MNIKKAYRGRLPCFHSTENDTESGKYLTGENARDQTCSVQRLTCLAVFGERGLALPLSAEEITVTVPPDPAPQAATANPAPAAPLPSFTAGGLQTSAADSDAADQGSAATPPPAAAPEPATTVVEPKAKQKSPATAQAEPTPAAEAPRTATTDTAPAPAKPAATPAAKPKVKQAAKPSPCKGLEEAACGSNKACKWTAPAATPDASGKVATPHCSSVASVKKKHPAKAAAPEVLPWAPKTTAAPPACGRFRSRSGGVDERGAKES